MKLVVNANILFSFFKKDSVTRKLLTSFEIFELYTPSLSIKELLKNREEICRKSKISDSELDEAIEDMKLFIGIVPDENFKDFGAKARKILGEHIKDIPYFALALSFDCGIWSNEKRLKKQSVIKIFSTEDLLKILKLR